MGKFVAFVVGLFALIMLLRVWVPQDAQRVEDGIRTRVESTLAENGLSWVQLDVDGRKVTLSGEAPTQADMEKAIGVSRVVSGVKTVFNNLDVAETYAGDLAANTSTSVPQGSTEKEPLGTIDPIDPIDPADLPPGTDTVDTMLGKLREEQGDDLAALNKTPADLARERAEAEEAAAEKLAAEQAESERAAAEKLVAEKARLEAVAAEEAEQAAAKKLAAEQAAAAAAEKRAAEQAAAEKLAAEKLAAEQAEAKAAAEKLAAEKAATEKAAAEKAAAEKAATEKAAAEKAAAEKAAAEKAAAEKAAAEKAAAEKAAAEKAAAEKAAAEKAAAEKAAAEKAAAEKAAAEKAAAEQLAAEPATAEKLAAEKLAAEKNGAQASTTDATVKKPAVATKSAPSATLSLAEAQKAVAAALSSHRIEFEPGSGRLAQSSYGVLNELASIAKRCPKSFIRIEGYTDASGGSKDNLKLSQSRALAVFKFLKSKGIPDTRLTAIGYGEKNPVADNATPEGRAKNRRIELKLKGL